MEIEKLINLQNKVYIHALNRKLGNVIPSKIINKQLLEGHDPHFIASLIVRTKKELTKMVDVTNDNRKLKIKPLTKFERFVVWLKRESN